MTSSRPARRPLFLLAACCAALVAAPAYASAAPTPLQLTLRLSDVPGYAIERTGPDPTCSAPVFVSDVRRDVRRLLRRAWRGGCNLMLSRVWTTPGTSPGPSTLQSVAEIVADPAAAAAFLRRPRGFASSVVPIPVSAWKPGETAVALGDEARLLRSGKVPYSDERRGAAVVWRTGSVVALVYATGCRQTTCEQTALRLAAVQQARIAAPAPLLPSDFDDSQVGLADPRLDVPVWWLGHDFAAPGLRHVQLISSVSAEPAERRYGARSTLTYGLNEEWVAFQIELVHPSALARPDARRELRALARDRCVRVERFRVPAGAATLYSRRRRCRTDVIIDRPTAILRASGVLLVIGCSDCFAFPQRYRSMRRYATPAGVRAIARALRPRELGQTERATPAP